MKSTSGNKYPWLPYVEFLLIFGILLAIDTQVGPGLGFRTLQQLPYLGLLLLFGVFYGIPLVLFASLFIGVAILIVFPWIQQTPIPPVDYGFFVLFFLGSLGSSSRIDGLKATVLAYRRRIRAIAQREWNVNKQNRVLIRVQDELEERVVRQSDSLILLSKQLRTLERSDLNEALNILLETIHIYSKCTKATIWVLDKAKKQFVLTTSFGYEPEERPPKFRNLEKNPQAWALKNLELYSVRNIQSNHEVGAYDDQTTILAMPIILSQGPWAVVSIEEMPFEKFNPYTETLVQLIVRLSEPGLRRIWELDRIYSIHETYTQTGLPLFSLLLRAMPGAYQRANEENSEFSVLIIELIHLDLEKYDSLIKEVETQLRNALPENAQLYHYKADEQLVVLLPDLGEDGVALMAINLLSSTGENAWPLEFILGYSTYHPGDEENPTRLFNSAEQLLEIQRI
ncbi:MAG: hypothetical protein GW949_04330 [Spirochaetales bacterium]|nr:hypothetical protein [Spirochaetales bacterium]